MAVPYSQADISVPCVNHTYVKVVVGRQLKIYEIKDGGTWRDTKAVYVKTRWYMENSCMKVISSYSTMLIVQIVGQLNLSSILSNAWI